MIAYVRPAAFQAKVIVMVEVLVVEKSFGQRFEGDPTLNCYTETSDKPGT